MTRWIVRESSSGRIFHLATKTPETEQVYLLFARLVLKIDTSGDFDTGNVDIDIEHIAEKPPLSEFKELLTDDEPEGQPEPKSQPNHGPTPGSWFGPPDGGLPQLDTNPVR